MAVLFQLYLIQITFFFIIIILYSVAGTGFHTSQSLARTIKNVKIFSHMKNN